MLRAKGSIFSFTNYVDICTYDMLVRTGIEFLSNALQYVDYVQIDQTVSNSLCARHR